MLRRFVSARPGACVMRPIIAALILLTGSWAAAPQRALAALPPSDACSVIKAHDLDIALPSGGSANNSLSGHDFAVGDVITFGWTGLAPVGPFPAISIKVNSVTTFTSNLAAGTTSITIAQIKTTLFEVANASSGPSSVTVTCDASSSPPPPPPPPPPSGLAADFLEQNAGSGLAALLGDAESIGTFAVSTSDDPFAAFCDLNTLRGKLLLLQGALDAAKATRAKYQARVSELKDKIPAQRRVVEDLDRKIDGLPYGDPLRTAYREARARAADRLSAMEATVESYSDAILKVDLEINDIQVEMAPIEVQIRRCEGQTTRAFYTDPDRASDPLGAFAAFFGDGAIPDTLSFSTVLGYSSAGVVTQPGATTDDWSFWAKGSVSGLSSLGATSFNALNGRIDLGASRPLGSSILVGGFLGWDGGASANATTGGTTASNALHMGVFGTYRLPNDMELALSSGGALGVLTSTIGGDTGRTLTQRAFVSAKLGGTAWADGPWRISPSASLFVGAEHQNAYVTTGLVAVPEQTIGLGRAKLDAQVGYTLPSELPAELFASFGAGYDFSNAAPFAPGQLSGTLGGGLKVSSGAMRGSVSGAYGLTGANGRTWSLNASIGGSF